MLVHQATPDEWAGELARLWPDAPQVSDPGGELYARYGVARGGWREMFGWRAWRRGVSSFIGGNRVGLKGDADGWTLPTVVVVRGGRVVWRRDGAFAGDLADPAEIVATLDT